MKISTMIQYVHQAGLEMDKLGSIVGKGLIELERLGRYTQQIIDEVSSVAKNTDWETFADFIRDMYELANSIKATDEAFAFALIDLNWPPLQDVYLDDMTIILQAYAEKGLDCRDLIDDYICSLYGDNELEETLEKWKNTRWLSNRIDILEPAVRAHQREDYPLVVPTLLPQIEGIIAYAFGHQGRMVQRHLEAYIKAIGAKDEVMSFSYTLRQFMLTSVLVGFEHGVEVNSSLSRHAILHGADTKYGSKVNSLKSILLFDFIQGSLACLGTEGGTLYHRPGCHILLNDSRKRISFGEVRYAKVLGLDPCKDCY